MADKNSVADWDTVANNNDNISSVNIAEGCAPSGINNAVRALMAQAKTKFDAVDIGISSAVPVSGVMHFARNTAPTGWLKANGAAISRTTYAALFAIIGTTYGVGNGTTTFNVPDLRGEFIRGWDDGRGIDAGRNLGALQADDFKAHNHTITVGVTVDSGGAHTHTASAGGAGDHNHGGVTTTNGSHVHGFSVNNQTSSGSFPRGTTVGGTAGFTTNAAGDHLHGIPTDGSHVHAITVNSGGAHTHTATGTGSAANTGGAETRPRNMALLACIKF